LSVEHLVSASLFPSTLFEHQSSTKRRVEKATGTKNSVSGSGLDVISSAMKKKPLLTTGQSYEK